MKHKEKTKNWVAGGKLEIVKELNLCLDLEGNLRD